MHWSKEVMFLLFLWTFQSPLKIEPYLLIAKLGAYGFERDSLSFMKSYLNDRQQRVCVNNNFSSLEKIIAGVPQGSILGPLLFNIFINDLFLFVSSSNLSYYIDDNTLYASGFNLGEEKTCLRTDFDAVTKWFYENHMALNAGKCHFMCFGKDTVNDTFIFKGLVMQNSKEQKLFFILDQLVTTNSTQLSADLRRTFPCLGLHSKILNPNSHAQNLCSLDLQQKQRDEILDSSSQPTILRNYNVIIT